MATVVDMRRQLTLQYAGMVRELRQRPPRRARSAKALKSGKQQRNSVGMRCAVETNLRYRMEGAGVHVRYWYISYWNVGP